MRSEFEKHYLSLDFYTKGSAQLGLEACTFDEKQDAYLPNMDWILENDEDECVTYCCMLNTAYLSFKSRQTEVDELQKRVDAVIHQAKEFIKTCQDDADIFEDKYQAKVAYGAEAVVELLEQALKGGES